MIELHLTDHEQRFRDEVREFLLRELPPNVVTAAARTPAVFVERDVALEWQRKLLAKGWLVPGWPREHGGTGWQPMERYIFESECAAAGAPALVPLGLTMVAPVIIRFGTEGQKGFYLPRILSGEDYWCQGYSEPGSGSDLASLRTRADPDGDDYIINGSKLWTTHAHFANRIFCLVRTSSEGKPQAGISFLLIDLDTPGIRITPIISMGGDHEVNQVFFDDVRVPKVNRVGAEGEGWTCAKYLLQFERGAHVSAPRLKRAIEHLRHIARSEADGEGGCLLDDRAVRRRLATFEADVAALEFTELRLIETLQKGGSPGIESSLIKTEVTELHQAMTELAMDLIGPGATLLDRRRPLPDAPGDCIGPEYWGPATAKYFNFRAASIYGGTNEIQRNLIAAYLLDL